MVRLSQRSHRRRHPKKKNARCIVHNPKLPSSDVRHYSVKQCDQCDQEHADSKRQYAHTFHKMNTICVAKAFYDLPQSWQFAILLHEVGHLLAGPKGSEDAANKAAQKASGIPIVYKDGPYGEELEWIPAKYKTQAKIFLFEEAA